MTRSQEALYQEATDVLSSHASSLQSREQKKLHPHDSIVATHGPALLKAIIADPTVLNNIGWYRINCSHLGKEHHLEAFAKYLRAIHTFVLILLDLQGPKPRIHEMSGEFDDKMIIRIDDEFFITYAPNNSPERFCTDRHLRVCFPEIVQAMEVGDTVLFDDGKMIATVQSKVPGKALLRCRETPGNRGKYVLKGRKGICVRNRPLGIDCITQYDRKSIEFARDWIGFDSIDATMVSYFSTPADICYFVRVMREYHYTGKLGGKFETPYAVYHTEEILHTGELSLVMLGRGDLRVEMDPRAIPHIHEIQTHFFALCRQYAVESICATGFLESMLTPEGKVTPEEVHDMEESVLTGADHLMLSAETSYGSQARNCITIEAQTQRNSHAALEKGRMQLRNLPQTSLSKLLYILDLP